MTRKLDGKDVANSHRRLRIDITDRDIAKGEPLDPNACAAAQAIRRALGKAAQVHRGCTYIDDGKVMRRYRTSAALRMETIIFDRGGRFMPGEYDLLAVPLSALAPKSKKKTTAHSKAPAKRRNIPGVRHSARSIEKEDE